MSPPSTWPWIGTNRASNVGHCGVSAISPLIETAFTSLVAFLVILDPPGTAVVFIALTQAMPRAKRRASAWVAVLLAGTILLLFLLATNMVFGRQTTAETEASAQGR